MFARSLLVVLVVGIAASAQERAIPLQWKEGSVGTLPLKEESYNSVLCVVKPGEVVVMQVTPAKGLDGKPILLFAGPPPVYVKGVKTAGLKSSDATELPGRCKVLGETVLDGPLYKNFDGSKVWVVEYQGGNEGKKEGKKPTAKKGD